MTRKRIPKKPKYLDLGGRSFSIRATSPRTDWVDHPTAHLEWAGGGEDELNTHQVSKLIPWLETFLAWAKYMDAQNINPRRDPDEISPKKLSAEELDVYAAKAHRRLLVFLLGERQRWPLLGEDRYMAIVSDLVGGMTGLDSWIKDQADVIRASVEKPKRLATAKSPGEPDRPR